ncbi:MAG: mechanosensitive ion channel family protein [Nitrososphaerales archaeon]
MLGESINMVMTKDEDVRRYGRLVSYGIAFVILLIVVSIGLYYLLYKIKIIPTSLGLNVAIELGVAAVLGYFIIYILGREISILSKRVLGSKRGTMVFTVYRFAAYIVLALVILYLAGVNGTALLAGGTFAGLVFGLAAQTVLSNIIAGIMIIIARPYEVGDRITFFSWQYGLIVPAYPPKFFSQDSIMPGYSGLVLDIGLAYTELQLDDGPRMKIPNSVMVGAAVVSHEIKERWVRTKYEIPISIDPQKAIQALSEAIKKNQWIVKPDSIIILINSTTPTSYVVSIDALCKGNMEEAPRSSILLDVMSVINGMIEMKKN